MRSTKIIKICSSSLCTCLHHMVILRTRNKITDFFMILAWASPFNVFQITSTACYINMKWIGFYATSRWWDEWVDTALQTHNSKFKPRRSETEHATSRSRRLPTILNLHERARKKHFLLLNLECQSGVRTCDFRLSKQAALTPAPGPPSGLLYFDHF